MRFFLSYVEIMFWREITKISPYIHEFVLDVIDLDDVTKHVDH